MTKKWLLARENYIKKQEMWAKDEKVELWFCDESGFEGDPRPRRGGLKKAKKSS